MGEPLVVGHLSGKPAACQLKHSKGDAAPAFSVTLGGVLTCETHLGEDVASEARAAHAKARAS